LTVTVVPVLAALGQELPSVVITVYTPLAVALYVVDVAPLIALPSLYHWLPLPALDVRVTLPPAQNVVADPALMVGVEGSALTVTVVPVLAALEHPLTVDMTVYTPLAVALYVVDVAPLIALPSLYH
jgi:hypothetical protein